MVLRDLEIEMPGVKNFSRIDILEIKIHIGKKLGSQKAEKYFGLLNSFFNLKLGKSEFNKLCIATIGRENIGMHNRLIRSILKNVCLSKSPPSTGNKVERLVIDKVANGQQKSNLRLLCKEVLPQSPRRGRTLGFQDGKSTDRLSPVSLHGKPTIVACNDLGHKTLEQQSAIELLSLGSRPVEINSVEDGEEVDQAAVSPGIHSQGPITPLLGIPWNGKGNRKKQFSSLLSSSVRVDTCCGNSELPDTSSLRKRLEQKLQKEGLGVSLECVNLLNSSLDVFLKWLIKSSLELAGSRVGNYKQENQMNGQAVPSLNGVRCSQKPSAPTYASMLDFRTAMELNPQMLGEDWPMMLEKVVLREFENWD